MSIPPNQIAAGPRIAQNHVDAVASFVEAAGELDFEPFFGKDEQFSMSNPLERPTTFYLGDRFQFRSALISFRRMWMQSEPSNWRNVVQLLTLDGIPIEIRNNTSLQSQTIEALIARKAGFLKDISASEVIDLWLNTVFAHGGIAGRAKRRDFEAAVDKHGQGRFEYSFRTLVKFIGEAFRRLSATAAKPALEFFEDQFSLKPSFRIDAAFGTKRKEITRDGDVIIRQASSEHFNEETFDQRFKRILNRQNFGTLKTLIEAFDCTTVDLLKALVSSCSFGDFLQTLGGDLETVSGDLLEDGVVTQAFAEGFCTGCGVQEGALLSAGYAFASPRARVRTSAPAVEALDRLLAAFKHELLQS